MRDFTFKIYEELIKAMIDNGYSFQTLENFLEKPLDRVVILRHDSDIWPRNDLKFAQIENKFGIQSTYYFRIPRTFNQEIIKEIARLGHEIGYHYEDLAEYKGDFSKAIQSFSINLNKLRLLYPVKTVAMHGRPLSKWDSRDLWNHYKLKDFALIGEPYLSIDYDKIMYITDTGSRWDGDNVIIRDTVNQRFDFKITTTFQFIQAFKNNKLPGKMVINAHAARWNDNDVIWLYRYFLQHGKNITKRYYKKLIRS